MEQEIVPNTEELISRVRPAVGDNGPSWLQTLLGPLRVDSKILLTFLCLAIGLLGVFWLGSEVLEGDTFALDKLIVRGLRTVSDPGLPIGPIWLKSSAIDITALGGVTVLTLITVLAAGYFIANRKIHIALFVAVAIASGALVNSGLKAFFARSRPEVVPHLVDVTSASFPSGHAMNSAMVYLTLAALVARSQEHIRVRLYLLGIAILLTMLVGTSRVYLGVHWPSDVIAGWCIGAIWAVLCSLIAKSFQRRQKIESEADQSQTP